MMQLKVNNSFGEEGEVALQFKIKVYVKDLKSLATDLNFANVTSLV